MSTQTVKQEIPAGTWSVDPVHSSIGFAVTHNGVSAFRSGFGSYEARLTGGEEPRLEGTVDVASIEIDEEQLKGHLLSPDFFDAANHPRLRFESSELDVAEDGSLRIRGELEIRGQKHEVEASGRFGQVGADLGGSARVGLSLEATVDRRDFGLDWNADLPSGGKALEYEVSIAVDLELVAAESA
ncbi:MAG TPA: YceI family protein [Solirubrobacterales bacterium]|jgi:polyisoprenoid-binding protein YceI|nr:YceI family protein [Solirubrobacterales bacterium]